LIGDRWALLVVRELLLGNHRFDELARNTGAPRDRLAARLRDLESAGVIERRRYQERPTRFEYHLTESGRDLGPVVQALRTWGDRWAVEEEPMVFRHSCGHALTTALRCSHCGEAFEVDELAAESLVPEWDVHGRVEPSVR
jgi:DNA-binding HxlR family transcriptional regulator